MKVKITSPFDTFGGTYKTTDLVFRRTQKSGELLASSKVKPRNPRTPDQEATRRIQKAAVRHWSDMSPEQRLTWNRFAQLYPVGEPRRSGRTICREATRMRLILGLEPRAEAPQFGVPLHVGDLSCEPSADPRGFIFRIAHAVESTAGHVVLMKITPPPPSRARTPRALDARCICGLGPQSTAPLPPSGGTIGFAAARFALEPGYPFCAVATIIRIEDGLASEPACFALVR